MNYSPANVQMHTFATVSMPNEWYNLRNTIISSRVFIIRKLNFAFDEMKNKTQIGIKHLQTQIEAGEITNTY